MLTRTRGIYLRKATRDQTQRRPKANSPGGRRGLKRAEKTEQNLKRLIKLGGCSLLLAQQLLFAACTLFTHEFQQWFAIRCILINISFTLGIFLFFLIFVIQKVELKSLFGRNLSEVCIRTATSICFAYRATGTLWRESVALPARCPAQPNVQNVAGWLRASDERPGQMFEQACLLL